MLQTVAALKHDSERIFDMQGHFHDFLINMRIKTLFYHSWYKLW